ncbi:hypothetical protein [Mycobacterium sp. AZCC_0083]|uniref:hypothetical protein n=1 Tax=Mycobacterium sp. AZCC_0083 TaxID=2735882 RepID=UPI001607267A|nr:hypothetical protein [Mycobacterium sp. AZCC_0083]MBB5166704.1 hypothetical protein [Mycobacterium sp. AZCC_0083]
MTTHELDKLIEHHDLLLAALQEQPTSYATFLGQVMTGEHGGPGIDWQGVGAILSSWRGPLEATAGDCYRRIDLHASAILMLTSEELVIEPVREIAAIARAQYADLRDLLIEYEYEPTTTEQAIIAVKMWALLQRVNKESPKVQNLTARVDASRNGLNGRRSA